jgi:2-polyprenyl-3-methyl-5-hydroxy-6-metoxy-1,4-benzoquinol methylase
VSHSYANVAGNFYDKYGTRNPIARALVGGFLQAFDDLAAASGAQQSYEIGCGEGMLSLRLLANGIRATGSDLEPDIVAEANRRAAAAGYGSPFAVRDLYRLEESEACAELVICCEVLEHVPNPAEAISRLSKFARPHLLVSVPREPLWRALNVARGKYITALGNTPGHINHWSPGRFLALIEQTFDIISVRKPLPWTMALCRVRR